MSAAAPEKRGVGRPRRSQQPEAGPAAAAAAPDARMLFSGAGQTNQDNCGNCNLGGELICCETCPQAFHYLCCDPPIDPENVPDGDWWCAVCRPKKVATHLDVKEPYTSIADRFMRTNSLEFKPPARVIKKFESFVAKSKKRQKAGKDDTTCFSCSRGTKLVNMMKCSQCPLVYHIDCLKQPGLAAEPVNFNGAPWLCPNHAEHHMARRKRPRISERGQNSELLTAEPEGMKLDFIKKVHKERAVVVERITASGEAAKALASEQEQFLGGVLAFQQEWWERQWNDRSAPGVMGPAVKAPEVDIEDALAMGQDVNEMSEAQQRAAVLKLRKIIRDGARFEAVSRHETAAAGLVGSGTGTAKRGAGAGAGESEPFPGCVATLRNTKSGEVYVITKKPFMIGSSRPAKGKVNASDAGMEAVVVPLDLDLEKELALKEADAHHATIFYDEEKKQIEFLNHSNDHPVWVDGNQCTAKQKESRVLGIHNILDIAGLTLVFDRTPTPAADAAVIAKGL